MGINAVRGPVGVLRGVGETEMACWMTAGVSGGQWYRRPLSLGL